MKKCIKCGIEKPLTEFYVHKEMKDGRLNKCIKCYLSDVKKRYKILSNNTEWVEKERQRGKPKEPHGRRCKNWSN